ncbi:MAG: DUF1838 family protein [Parasphingorhabdus sp.]|uniref:DUF1838 family protein n=1 Tax=Parasphingorhabdus sp. TaxID=2709688 RepID=UPI00329855B0
MSFVVGPHFWEGYLAMTANISLYRRDLLFAGLGGGTLALSTGSAKALHSPAWESLSERERFHIYIKLVGSLDTSDVYIWFKGVLWGALPQRLPVPFCGFQGLARHRWTANEKEGVFLQKSFDVGFFSDLETGLPIREISNPLTGETNQVFHNKYGGFERKHNFAEFIERGDDKSGKTKRDWRTAGNQACLNEISSGQFTSKLQPEKWPRETSGPLNFYAGETSYSTQLDHLLDPNVRQADFAMFWSSFSPWEPWLLMDAAPGNAQWRATGMKLNSYKDAPREMLEFIEKDQPNYFDDADPWPGVLSNTDRFIEARSPQKLAVS